MRGMTMKVVGKKLVIEVPLDQKGVISKSGKSQVLASTEGNVSLPKPNEEVKVGLNVYKSA